MQLCCLKGNFLDFYCLNTDQAKFLGAASKKIIATNVHESDAGRPRENCGPAPEVKIKTTRIVAS